MLAKHAGMDFYLQGKSCFARLARDHLAFFKFHKNGDIRKLKADCERMISVNYIMNALEHSKVRLPFF